MNVIYRPKGRAAEYSHLAINHYIGCRHGCVYCYCPAVMRNPDFHTKPRMREGVLAALQKEAPKFTGTGERVLLCFASDPYQPLNNATNLTREVIKILISNDIPFQVLTKGGMRAVPDFDLYRPGIDAFGSTLTFLDPAKSLEAEPCAPTPANRIRAIERAHEEGIETWVSLEPVLDAKESLAVIERTHGFVDLFKIGILNHQPSDINWRKFGTKAIELCREYKTDYYIKADLAKYLDGIHFCNIDNRKVKREPLNQKPDQKSLFEE